jgi:demethylmenaquinone methyltransferase/2-methoxy-6-polyprenyl-1,4-benzoquinol methylase
MNEGEYLNQVKLDKSTFTISQMFNKVSTHYDFMNDLITGFSHRKTRKKALHLVSFHSYKRVLDLATGTGDFAFLVQELMKETEVVIGVDISRRMLSIAKNKARNRKFKNLITYNLSDINHLPFRSNIFDLCTIGYGIRNVSNPSSVLKEIRRVTQKSGYLVIVEATSSSNSVIRFLSNFYFRKLVPTLARLLCLKTEAYSYLAESIVVFPSAQKFTKMITNAGWRKVKYFQMYLGTVTIFIAKK